MIAIGLLVDTTGAMDSQSQRGASEVVWLVTLLGVAALLLEPTIGQTISEP